MDQNQKILTIPFGDSNTINIYGSLDKGANLDGSDRIYYSISVMSQDRLIEVGIRTFNPADMEVLVNALTEVREKVEVARGN